MGRRKIEIHEPPPDHVLAGPDCRIWVEGETWVAGSDESSRYQVDLAREALGKINLTLMEYPAPMDLKAPKRRSWTQRRVTMYYAEAILMDFPNGIRYSEFTRELYHEEPWTELKQFYARKKASVMVHRLVQAGLVDKRFAEDNGETVLYYRKPQTTEPSLHVHMAAAKAYLKRRKAVIDEVLLEDLLQAILHPPT